MLSLRQHDSGADLRRLQQRKFNVTRCLIYTIELPRNMIPVPFGFGLEVLTTPVTVTKIRGSRGPIILDKKTRKNENVALPQSGNFSTSSPQT
jgi:hypothetical protein